MNSEDRGSWYLLTGLLLGIALGLLYAWRVQPVEYMDTSPALLRADFKDQYRSLIASAYAANNDLLRARARLELLGDQDLYRVLSEQAQRTLAQDASSTEARDLGLLAIAIGREVATPGQITGLASASPGAAPTSPPAVSGAPVSPTLTSAPTSTPLALATTALSPSPTPSPPSMDSTPVLSATALMPSPPAADSDATPLAGATAASTAATEVFIPRPTFTPVSTRTPTSTPGGPFVLVGREKICSQELLAPLIQVYTADRFGQPIPGILIIVSWEGGEERFFTGLKIEKGLGYADFSPVPGIKYSLRAGLNGLPVNDISAAECERQSGERFWGAWILRFVQP